MVDVGGKDMFVETPHKKQHTKSLHVFFVWCFVSDSWSKVR